MASQTSRFQKVANAPSSTSDVYSLKQQFQKEIKRLNGLLKEERAKSSNPAIDQLRKELDQVKTQLAKEKSVNQTLSSKDKETQRELENLMKNTSSIQATLKHDLKTLQQAHEDLKVTYLNSQKNFSSELQKEKNIIQELQNELGQCKDSYQQLMVNFDKQVSVCQLSKASDHQTKQKLKKLNQAYKDLKVTHLNNKQNFSSELQKEKSTIQDLQNELGQLKDSYQQLKINFDKQVSVCQLSKNSERKTKQELQQLQLAHEKLKETFLNSQKEVLPEPSKTKVLHKQSNEFKASYQDLKLKHNQEISVYKISQEMKKLQQMNADLNATLVKSQNQLLSELQKEKCTVRELQSELNLSKVLYEDLKLKYNQDVLVSQHLKYIKDKSTGEPQDIKLLRAEHDAMCKTLIEANRSLYTSTEQTKIQMQAELDEVKDSLVLHKLNSGWDQALLVSQLKVYDQLLREETEAHCQTQTSHFLELNGFQAESSLGQNQSPKRKRPTEAEDDTQNREVKQRKLVRRE